MIQLLILGLLKEYSGSYGYELLSLMDTKHFKYLVNYTKGSFYYNLQQMEVNGFIMQKNSDRDEDVRRYYVTDKGELEFNKLMSKYGNISEYINLKFYLPMLFSSMIENDEYLQLLDSQIGQTEERILNIKNTLDQERENLDVNFSLMLENSLEHHKVNLKWFKQLRKKYEE